MQLDLSKLSNLSNPLRTFFSLMDAPSRSVERFERLVRGSTQVPGSGTKLVLRSAKLVPNGPKLVLSSTSLVPS